MVRVLPSARGQGIGSELAAAAADAARGLGKESAWGVVGADDPGSLRFAESRGFPEVGRDVKLTRRLSLGEGRRGDGVVQLEEEHRAGAYAVAVAAIPDMVTAGQAEARPYEDWVEQELDDAAVAFVALEEGRVVGYATLQRLGDDHTRLEHGFTGVLPECRRRGIATALGDAQIEWAAGRRLRGALHEHGRDEHRLAPAEGEARVPRRGGTDSRARAGMSVIAPPRWEVVYAEAHAERFRYLAGSGAEFLRRPGVLAVRTGADSNVDNGIVLEREDADIEGLTDWFHEPASLICSGFEAPDELRERLAALGVREETTGVTTGAVLGDLPPLTPPPGVSIEEDDEPRPLPIRHWVARRDERRVGDASAFFTSSTVLLEHVEVAEEERRRGIGTALALVRLHEGRRLGCGLAVFGTTPESAALYEQFGFTTQPDEGRCWFYLPTP